MGAKLTVVNKTHYQSRDLRRFFIAAAKAQAVGGVRRHDKHITVVYSKKWAWSGSVWGCATLGRGRWVARGMRFALPKDPAKLNLMDLARVYRHEAAHNLGLQHGEMESDLRYCTGPDPEWAAGLEIRVKEKKARPSTQEKRAVKLEVATAALATWERKAALAKTKVKKWTRRVRALSLPMAARS